MPIFISGTGLSCYYCGYHETCSADEPGQVVQCQMEDPREHHFGDSCEVAHSGITKKL